MIHRTSDLTVEQQLFASTPIDARKRAEQVRDKLIELIREGHLKEGEKLPTESQLSTMFGVGRSSIREAVQSLMGLGLVEMRAGRGAYIRRLSLNDLVRLVDGAVRLEYGAALQLHEVRAMIEITAARLAATRRTEADLAQMKEAILRFRIAEHTNNAEGQVDADLAFHKAIVEATRNLVMASLLESISGLLREHRRRYVPDSDDVSVPEAHERICEAISACDPLRSALQMQRHMRDSWRHIELAATRGGDSTLAGQAYLPMYDEPPE